MNKPFSFPRFPVACGVMTLLAGLLAAAAVAQDSIPPKETLVNAFRKAPAPKTVEHYSPAVNAIYPSQVYWGDTHVHTEMSMDAGSFGARLQPADAYRFARGEAVVSATQQPAQLARPLDFLVVADHSDNMGWFEQLYAGNEKILANEEWGQKWYDDVHSGNPAREAEAGLEIIDMFSRGDMPPEIMFFPGDMEFDNAWTRTIQAAEEYNDPGEFTAFIGYEWTSQEPPGQNLHRVVIYRDGQAEAEQTLPFTTYPPPETSPVIPVPSNMPEKLWEVMDAYETTTGGQLLAIPHNGNLSNGWMFPEGQYNPATKQPLTQEYVEARARWEPLYEVTQIKGDGEAHPLLSPDDQFADFGTWDKGNLNLSEVKETEMLQREYARTALETGLQLESEYGVNPYKFGMVGSTDTHTALATADEDNFFGKHAGYEPGEERWEHAMMQSPDGELVVHGYEQLASGYAAVWATGNTRAELFDAMERKEVYATTGTRPQVRFFGGWDFETSDATDSDFVQIGYSEGVPMGGDLSGPPPTENGSPTFLVSALKDPVGAYLDRVQIIKGWLDDGQRREKVYDIAVSGDRTIGPDGKCPEPVGNTVDLATATWTNTIGAPLFNVWWQDPDFNANARAFYYVRVIEIPTPRWTNYDAVRYGIDDMPSAIKTSQERAYTSPIWYTPVEARTPVEAGTPEAAAAAAKPKS